LDSGLIHTNVIAVFVDADENIWFGTTKGLSVHTGADWFNYTGEEGLISDTINHITSDMEGNIWIATPAGIEMFSDIPGLAVLKAPGLISPENLATELVPDEVTLTWKPITGAIAYALQINMLDDFTDPWLSVSDIPGTSYLPASLANEQQYFWRVAGTRSGETGPWSEVWNFTTAKADAIPPVEAVAHAVVVYPNPAKDRIYLYGVQEKTQIRVNIYTINGQLIGTPFNFYNSGRDFRFMMDISDKSKYPTGVYIMQVAGDTFNKMIKITIL